ncbi:hypothetical protein C3L33_20813, partial [Rhododendron williamsianum]
MLLNPRRPRTGYLIGFKPQLNRCRFIVSWCIGLSYWAFEIDVKSGRLCSEDRVTTDFCEEYVENSVKNHIVHEIESENQKREDKIIEDNVNYGERRRRIDRTYSENLDKVGGEKEKMKRQLRRTVTEGRRKSTSAVVGSSPAEEMSNEEFRRTVEDFIARQQRSLREEEFSAIVSSY